MKMSFLGRGWNFPIRVDSVTGYIQTVQDEEDVKQAILIILRTAKGERVMRPDFGCGIRAYAFATTDPATLRMMEVSVKEAIDRWEPRVEHVHVQAKIDPVDPAKVLIDVQYVIRATNTSRNLVYTFDLLEEGSHVPTTTD